MIDPDNILYTNDYQQDLAIDNDPDNRSIVDIDEDDDFDSGMEEGDYNQGCENMQDKLFEIIENEDVEDCFDLNGKFLA